MIAQSIFFPNFFPLELKSSKTNSFSYQRDKKDKGKNIKINQINGLLKASEVNGVYAGFLFNFSTLNKTYWVNIKDFYTFYSTSEKGSLNEKDIINSISGILVNQSIKKVHYNYNISKMIDDITNTPNH